MVNQSTLSEEEQARVVALKYISLGLIVAVLAGEIVAFVMWLSERTFPIIPATILILAVGLLSLISYWLARAGQHKIGGFIFVIGFLLECAIITVMFGGATGPMGVIYIFPILAAGLLIGINYSFLIAALATILYLAMIFVEQAGVVSPIYVAAATGGVDYLFVAVWILFFFLVAFLSWFAASRLYRALDNVRSYAGELQTANEKLQASEEELRASNEELEAANEELRATEEELRSSNEELETANEELKEAQEQMVRTEKLAAIGQLAGGVGHELRNPLGAIKNAVYYIRGKLAQNELAQREPRIMDFLTIVDDEINSSNKIINDLLNFSRVGKPAVSPARIEKVIADAIAHTHVPENVELIKKVDSALPEVEMDTEQIRQVFVNIITNAVQAMPEGGKLSVEAGQGNGFLEINIGDTGVGIPKEALSKIFDPLFTMKAKGIGLGLAVCKSIVERHQGSIEVKSEVGKGTTFAVKLPLHVK